MSEYKMLSFINVVKVLKLESEVMMPPVIFLFLYCAEGALLS